MLEKLLTVEQLSQIIGIKAQTIYKQKCNGRLLIPFVVLPGGDLRFKPSEVEKFLERRTIKPLQRH